MIIQEAAQVVWMVDNRNQQIGRFEIADIGCSIVEMDIGERKNKGGGGGWCSHFGVKEGLKMMRVVVIGVLRLGEKRV